MNLRKSFVFSRAGLRPWVFLLLFPAIALHAGAAEPAGKTRTHPAYLPGERLTYSVSWSNIVEAGTAVMEVTKGLSPEGKETLQFISTARSVGLVEKFYKVRDVIKSVVDPRTQQSLSYSLDQRHGKRKKKRELVFDQEQRKVIYLKEGFRDVVDVPEGTQDALSSLYYVRSQPTFTVSAPIIVNVHDSGKTWSVEVHVLGREKLRTPLGEFNTIKLKTYPKYEGVFMHKGEIFMWLTDDERRVPVLMKSTITIGSIMATLTEMRPGEDAP